MAKIRVRIKLLDENTARPRLISELEDSAVSALFRDVDTRADVLALHNGHRNQSRGHRRKRKHGVGGPVPNGERVATIDYQGEPPYLHPGIHLHFNGFDEIEWFSDQRIDFSVDVGPDPELILIAGGPLPANQDIHHAELIASLPGRAVGPAGIPPDAVLNPFSVAFPLVSLNGAPVRSGPLRRPGNVPAPEVLAQRYYKFTVSILETDITLDPHFETHDDF